jgi:hypothetical protein
MSAGLWNQNQIFVFMGTMKNFLLFILCVAPLSARLVACSCIGESTVKGSVKSSDLVIVGNILTGERIDVADTSWSPGKDSLGNDRFVVRSKMKYRVLVTQTFKGKFKGDTITLLTGMGSGDCGYHFNVGSSYIIYGYKDAASNGWRSNTFTTNICTRTRPATDISEIDAIRKATSRWGRSAH